MNRRNENTLLLSIKAGLLSWLLPGLGHWLLGHRALAIVFFVAVTFPYMVGAAIGGVMSSVNPRENLWLFAAEMGVVGYTAPLFTAAIAVEDDVKAREARGEKVDWTRYRSFYPESDVSQIYLATAGLLNLLVILDAISRAQTGLPTFHRHLLPNSEQPT